MFSQAELCRIHNYFRAMREKAGPQAKHAWADITDRAAGSGKQKMKRESLLLALRNGPEKWDMAVCEYVDTYKEVDSRQKKQVPMTRGCY